jgi:hypothetical protein
MGEDWFKLEVSIGAEFTMSSVYANATFGVISTSSKYSFIDRYVTSSALTCDELNTTISRTNTFTVFLVSLTSSMKFAYANSTGLASLRDNLTLFRPNDFYPHGHKQPARRGGAQFITLRTTYCDTLESIIGEDCMKSGSGTLKEWFSLAQSPAKWPNCWPRLRDSAASHATINIQTKRYGNTHVKEQQFMRTKVQTYTN